MQREHWTWGTDSWECPDLLGHLLLAWSCAGDTLGPRRAPQGIWEVSLLLAAGRRGRHRDAASSTASASVLEGP